MEEQLSEAVRREGRVDFARSGGPGGQNVNKVNSKVVLSVPVERLPLSEDALGRVRRRLGNRINSEGELVIHAAETRSQTTNREQAVERAVALIREAARPTKRRRPTKPTRGAKERRLKKKKARGEKKRLRRDPEE